MMTDLRSLADTVEIARDVRMPILGLGTYKSAPGTEVEREVGWALEIGYRGIDTAALYRNEAGVGRAVRESGIPRDEIFVATKVWNSDQGYGSTLRAFERSLSELGLDFVDLYLVHWPIPRLMRDTWRAMEEISASRRCRAIGVCNFLIHHLEELASFADVPPAVDQLEMHPWLPRRDVREWCAGNGVTVQAWAPVIRGKVNDIPLLREIAERHGKTPAQVSIRWLLQHGVTTIPKSVHRERLAENADVFDFSLTAEEMGAIDALDAEERIGPDPDRYGGA